MALISHADWLDRFGDLADDADDLDLDLVSLRFKVVPQAIAPRRERIGERPLLGYRAGPPYLERRAAPRLSR